MSKKTVTPIDLEASWKERFTQDQRAAGLCRCAVCLYPDDVRGWVDKKMVEMTQPTGTLVGVSRLAQILATQGLRCSPTIITKHKSCRIFRCSQYPEG